MHAITATESRSLQGARPSVFFSYSRSDTMLVDQLGRKLRGQGLDTWIDYQELIPGRDWEHQLSTAVDESDVVLVIVSRRSVESRHVQKEWQLARRRGVPMILVIAEAAELDPQLIGLPWIDLRARSRRQMGEIADAIELAVEPGRLGEGMPPPAAAPPQHGFRAPIRVWSAFVLSIGTAAISLLAAWTLVIPVVLLPLPVRILRRSFTYTDVRNALVALPFALVVTGDVISRQEEGSELFVGLTGITAFGVGTLFLLIRSGSFRRWVKPAAARPKRTGRRRDGGARRPATVQYRVDVVPEDRAYADAVDAALAKHGHERVEGNDASTCLRYISQFHDVHDVDPEVRTIPIVVADADDELPAQLRRTQWIDLRRGPDRRTLDELGRHLDEPGELFRLIGSPPPHEQHVLPKWVQGLFVTLWVGIGAVIGYGILVVAGVRSELEEIGTPFLAWSAVVGLATVGAALWLTRKLRRRRPARLRSSLVFLVSIGLIAVAAPIQARSEVVQLSDEGFLGLTSASAIVYSAGYSMLCFWIASFRPIRRWIPARRDDSSADGTGRSGTTYA